MTAINLKVSKLLEMFKGMKSDAVPRAPRPSAEDVESEGQNVNDSSQEQEEEIIIEPEPEDDLKKQKKSKIPFFKTKKVEDNDDDEKPKKKTKDKSEGSSSVNVQATGNVYNIVNAKDVRLGNDYYFGPVAMSPQKTGKEKQYQEEVIEKDNLIRLVMEATIKPDHDYLDYISKNLGKNWHTFFRSLGFTQGRIETAEINAAGYDISEARYKLLLDWVNNEDDCSLGRLTNLLWDEGERSIVKNLSVMYKKSKKR
ncbi:unnamed protein product [Chrysodeixis includens]|uniref:Death domain-containing protein n=1 Tax=Chrysodeixis includens TaxID=689277 RepID=A0A9P0BTG9_CHRIL|nr:unnamed protein product [Chrysodeixis includens]